MKVNKHLSDIYRKDVVKESELMQKCILWFDSLKVNPLLSYFTVDDINQLHKIAMSPAMHCDMPKMYRTIGELMNKRGFKLIGGGTNRRAYECIYDNRIVAKVATDPVGFTSNLREYINQNVLKPFCNKIFEVSPCGSIAIIEKVVPIKDVSEFKKYSLEIFDILYFKIRDNSIAMEDIGTRSMKNWGYRSGFGPVLLDYPTMYVADPKKRLCKNIVNGRLCCGTLDYDEGFNRIVCSECGRTYFAKSLSKPEGDDVKSLLNAVGYLKKEGVSKMKFEIINKESGEVIESINCGGTSNHVDPINSNHIIGGSSVVNNVTAFSKKKKRPTVMIVDLNTEDEKEESIVNNTESFTATIEEPESNIQIEKEDDKKTRLLQKFNEYNSGIKFESVGANNSSTMSITDLAKTVNEVMTVDANPFVNETDAFKIYMDLSIATVKDNNTKITAQNVGTANTMINDMLRKISNTTDLSIDMMPVFFKIINNVKNTLSFFNSILSLWYAFIDTASFDSSNSEDSYIYCIFTDLIDIYRNIVYKALEDYKFNIVMTRGTSYNISNILSSINVGISQIEDFVSSIEDLEGVNYYNYVNIEINRDYMIISEIGINVDDMQQKPSEEPCDAITNEEDNSNQQMSPVELYDAMVKGNEKTGTKHQQERFNEGGKRRGKRNKKNRHNH